MAKSYTIIDKSQYAMKFYADNLSNKKFAECVDACKKNVDIKNYSSSILYDEMLQLLISKISSTRNNKASSLTPFKQQIAKALYQRVFVEEVIDEKANKKQRVNKLNDLSASMVDRAFQDVVTSYCNQISDKYLDLSFEYRGEIDHYELY